MQKINQLKMAKASASIGYAIGVMEGLADLCRGLNKRQKECLDDACEGLQSIDLCEIMGITGERPDA